MRSLLNLFNQECVLSTTHILARKPGISLALHHSLWIRWFSFKTALVFMWIPTQNNEEPIFSYVFFSTTSNMRSCPWVIDQFRKSECIPHIWGKCREILLHTVFNNSRTRPNMSNVTISLTNSLMSAKSYPLSINILWITSSGEDLSKIRASNVFFTSFCRDDWLHPQQQKEGQCSEFAVNCKSSFCKQ